MIPKPNTAFAKKISPLLRDKTLGIVLSFCVFALVACGGAQADEQPDPLNIRAPHPTFTPTPPGQVNNQPAPAVQNSGDAPAAAAQSAAPQTDAAPESAASPAEDVQADNTEPKAIINAPLVNVRTGPGTNYAVVTEVERGAEFTIVGKDEIASWWQICCYNDQEVWVIGTFVDTVGSTDAIQVATDIPAPPPVQEVVVAPAAPPPAATATSAPAATEPPPPPEFAYNLELYEQFPENKVVRVFLYVHDDRGGIPDYSVRVIKDGTELPVAEKSFGPQPGFTWPIADGRQRFQNMKVEFPGQSPAGTWEVQLIDSSGTPSGPPVVFNLAANEPNQELYVRYDKK